MSIIWLFLSGKRWRKEGWLDDQTWCVLRVRSYKARTFNSFLLGECRCGVLRESIWEKFFFSSQTIRKFCQEITLKRRDSWYLRAHTNLRARVCAALGYGRALCKSKKNFTLWGKIKVRIEICASQIGRCHEGPATTAWGRYVDIFLHLSP